MDEPDWVYAPPPGLPVRFVDRDVVVVDKPSGLLSVPGRSPDLTDSALTRVQAQWPGALATHRLDLDTSGLLVFALRRKAEAELHRQFRERVVRKLYLACVAGVVSADSGWIERPLRVVPGVSPRSVVDLAEGRPASTAYRVLRRETDRSWLALYPSTGRPHQLRVHLLDLGHPILGDRFYAPKPAHEAMPRLALHALDLHFVQPWSQVPMSVLGEAPPEWALQAEELRRARQEAVTRALSSGGHGA